MHSLEKARTTTIKDQLSLTYNGIPPWDHLPVQSPSYILLLFVLAVVDWIVSYLQPSPYSGLGMCNTMRAIQQISLVPECFSIRLDSSGLASVCKSFKGLFMTPRPAGRKPSTNHLLLLEKITSLIFEV